MLFVQENTQSVLLGEDGPDLPILWTEEEKINLEQGCLYPLQFYKQPWKGQRWPGPLPWLGSPCRTCTAKWEVSLKGGFACPAVGLSGYVSALP